MYNKHHMNIINQLKQKDTPPKTLYIKCSSLHSLFKMVDCIG